MKRDVDLCRRILLDLESQGAECAVKLLRTDLATNTDERVRYHLRLLIDAGWVQEVDHATNGSSCVRLTHAGVEMLELCRSDARWHDAKGLVLDRTGTLSLTVLQAVLTKWAVEGVSYGERYPYRRYYRSERPRYERAPEDRYYLDDEANLHLLRSRPEWRDRYDWREPLYTTELRERASDTREPSVGVSLPVYLM